MSRLISDPVFAPSGLFGNQTGGTLEFTRLVEESIWSEHYFDFSISADHLSINYDRSGQPLWIRSNHPNGNFETGEKDASPLRCVEVLYNWALELGQMMKTLSAVNDLPRSWQLKNEIWNGMKAPQLRDLN